jgi:signal transduction histidine kinase
MEEASRKNQQLDFTHALEVDFFTVDRKLLHNILVNLVSNAIKYSPENSTIKINGITENGHLVVSVSDQGIGISEEDQRHLFERFYRASNTTSIQGTGLGLHIVRRYLDLMGGEVLLKSKLNEGTTITISIPQPKERI